MFFFSLCSEMRINFHLPPKIPKQNKMRERKKKRCVFNEYNLRREKLSLYKCVPKDRQFSQINKSIFFFSRSAVRKIPMPYGTREKKKIARIAKGSEEKKSFGNTAFLFHFGYRCFQSWFSHAIT